MCTYICTHHIYTYNFILTKKLLLCWGKGIFIILFFIHTYIVNYIGYNEWKNVHRLCK